MRIDCSQKGLVFQIKVGNKVLKLQSESFDNLQIVAFTTEAGNQIGCGARKPENAVVVTYRALTDTRAKADGEIVAIEFVPNTFQLKQ